MPPHCDTLDGPVVTAARQSLETENIEAALAYVPADGEGEVRAAFDLARKARLEGEAAREVADLYFFDTVVRVHRRGEGAAHTGLKPAGMDVGPVIPVAEEAADAGDPWLLIELLQDELEQQVVRRITHVHELATHAHEGLPAARAAISARLELLVWAHQLRTRMRADGHDNGDGHDH